MSVEFEKKLAASWILTTQPDPLAQKSGSWWILFEDISKNIYANFGAFIRFCTLHWKFTTRASATKSEFSGNNKSVEGLKN